jgi:uncharacterized protein
VNPGLLNLIALQEIEQRITSSQKQIVDLPARVQAIRQEIDSLKQSHQQKMIHLQEQSKKRRAFEGDVDLMRTKLSRLRDQLMTVKTNKEYTAMQHEIQTAENQIRAEEDKILEIMEELEGLEGTLKDEEKSLGATVSDLERQISQLEASVPGIETEGAKLRAEKARLEGLIELDLLARYRRIADASRGVGLADATSELCSACHVRIRPQVFADLRATETIHSCDSCSRILYLRV